MKIRFFILTIIYLVSSHGFYAQNIDNALKDFINHPAFKHASIGVSIADLSGNPILSLNADKSLTPASTLKIVTTASALELLGADFKYQTRLHWNATNSELIIEGSGDPTLGSTFLGSNKIIETWIEKIISQIGTAKNIRIYLDDSYFGRESTSRKWTREDMGNYYASGAYGISFLDNTYALHFNTMRRDTCPIITKTIPHIDGLNFTNLLHLNTNGADNGYILNPPYSYNAILSGDIPTGRSDFRIKGAIPNPALLLGQTLSKELNKKGIKVKSITTALENGTREYSNKQPFYTHHSQPLSKIIRVINEKSNNHYTEHLIRTIGKRISPNEECLQAGINAISKLWQEKGMNTDALFMYDGCGLSPVDAVSPKLMTDILAYMQTESTNADTFLYSLPLAGKEGTVRYFLTKNKHSAYVKSGSIGNVRCYAGYLIEGEKKYAFSIMVNNFNGSHKPVVRAIEKLLYYL